MKKSILIAALVGIVGLAYAGFDQYTGKNYTAMMAPQLVNASAVTGTSAVVSNYGTTNAVTNTVACVDVSGLPGNGALVLAYVANNTALASLTFALSSSATTNGTFVAYTNAAGVSSWSYTNAAGFATVSFRPNTVSRYLRIVSTPANVTNGVAGAVLVTE